MNLQQLKQRAGHQFRQGGLPTEHDENWLYTDLGELSTEIPEAAAGIYQGSGADILLVNGYLTRGPVVSLDQANPEIIRKILECYEAETYDPFAAWNLARCSDIHIARAKGRQLLQHHITFGQHVAHTRLVVVADNPAEKNRLHLLLSSDSGGSFTNLHLLLLLEPDTSTELLLEFNLAASDLAVLTLQAQLAGGAHLRVTDLQLSGKLTRLTFDGRLLGSGAELTLNGLQLGYGSRHSDSATSIRHLAAHTQSRETYYSLLNHVSSSAFTGHIYVAHGAQQTDARQLNRALLLSEAAKAYSRPQLEINADDVKCSHGASIGRLDAAALFYLRSRGMDETQARAMLLEALGREILENVDAGLREAVESKIMHYLNEVAREPEHN